jgi:large subunit ribosomal protein L28
MVCDICSKRRMVGNQISHSNIKTKKRQNGNIQKVRAVVNGTVQRVYACTRCLRSGRVAKAS